MVTVRHFLIQHRKRLLIGAIVLTLLIAGALGGYLWSEHMKPAKPLRSSPRPTALPAQEVPGQEISGTGSAAVAGPPDVAAPTTDDKSKATATDTQDLKANAKTIVVESQGKAATLDVQTVMALQRESAERRLYDRVMALSAGRGSSAATTVKLAPGPINVPPTRADESALGSLLGGKNAVDRVPTGTSGLSSGSSDIPTGAPGEVQAVPQSLDRPVIRLVSIYARGELLMAELILPSGRRIDLEKDDELMGFRVLRVDEGGLTLAGWHGSSAKVFLAVGKTLLH